MPQMYFVWMSKHCESKVTWTEVINRPEPDFLTFGQFVNAQLDMGEISSPYLSSELIESDPAAQHDVIDDTFIMGHVIDDPLEGCLLCSLLCG